jgi:uncharacterized membrane protein YphA (DoxX/SURF4 family)
MIDYWMIVSIVEFVMLIALAIGLFTKWEKEEKK